MSSKKVTISFKISLEEFQDYIANLRELGIHHHSDDLRNYVIGFNKSFGVDVIIKRNEAHIENYQKENKRLSKIKKERLDTITNKAFQEIKKFADKYDVTEGEIELPGTKQILIELGKIQDRARVDLPTMLDMFESNVTAFKDDTIKEELLIDIGNIRDTHHLKKSEVEV
jgi:hypothetical protein